MEKFKKLETGIKDLLIIEPKVLGDNRGFFFESYSERDFEKLGIREKFLQENHSLSHRGTPFSKGAQSGKAGKSNKGRDI